MTDTLRPLSPGVQALRDAQQPGRYGFLDESAVAQVAADPATRTTTVLVRCGAARFLAPAQDVPRLIAAVEAAGDYVRDVSLPASHMERAS